MIANNNHNDKSTNNTTSTTPDKQIVAKVSRKGFHPQIYDQNQKISKDLSAKLNKTVVLPKLAPKPTTAVKPTSIDQVDNKNSEIKRLDLPPMNAEVVQNQTTTTTRKESTSVQNEPELDIDSLPPPPIEWMKSEMNDLKVSKEEINNQINENIDNELKEKNASRSTAVRNLATKFEQISVSSPNKPPLPPVPSTASRSIKRIPSVLSEQQQQQKSPTTAKQSSTGLRVAVLGSRNQCSPTLIYKNSSTSRPDKPPDYESTIKRLNFIQQQHQMQQQGNKLSIDSNYSLVSLPSSLNSSLDSPFKNSNSSSQNTRLPAHEIQQLKQQQYNTAVAVRKNKTCKKSVSFSDEVIIVAHPEDQEEHLPNPLLDRVLKQKNVNNTNLSIS